MKKNWEIRKLDEICDFGNGLWTGKKPPFINVGVIRNTNFTKEGTLDDADIVFLDVEQSQFAKRKLKFGDIILEKSGGGPKQPVGRVIVFNKKEGNYSFSNFTSLIRIINPKQTDFTYLHRYLFFSYISGVTENMQSHSTGIRNLKFDDYKDIEIPLPPLAEQQCIVVILDEAFATIAKAKANAEQNLKNANELFEGYLRNVLSDKKWNVSTLGDVCERVEYGSSSKSKEIGAIAVLRMGNIQKGRFNWDNLVFSDDVKENKKYILKYNDVLFNRTNSPELVGKTAIYKGEIPAIFAGYLIRIHRKEDLLNADYLNYYLNSEMAMNYGKSVTISSVNQANINGTKLKTYPIPLPSLKEQQNIVQKLDALSDETKKLEAIYQQKLNDLEELKKSILQKAFNGELKTTKEIAL
jgi:type I restriction enzyme, S subunit